MIKVLLASLLSYLGYEIVSKNNIPSVKRNSMEGLLLNILKHYNPQTIIDVGAAFGDWTKTCLKIFPSSKYILFEPLEEYKESINTLKKNKDITYLPFAASAKEGILTFHKHDDLVGSSMMNEVEGSLVDGKEIKVDTTTIDKILIKQKLPKNILLKIDVQGAELEVLAGAEKTLKNTECVILEISFFRSFIRGVDLFDVIAFMKQKGFVVYDIGPFLYRPYDGALSQTDMVFVKENGLFRKFQGYATPEQRKVQNDKFKQKHDTLVLRS